MSRTSCVGHSIIGRTVAGLLVAGVVLAGCGGPARPRTAGETTSAAAAPAGGSKPAPRAVREQLLAGMVSILSALDRYDESRGGEQAFDRLVQWRHAAGAAALPAADGVALDALPAAARVGLGCGAGSVRGPPAHVPGGALGGSGALMGRLPAEAGPPACPARPPVRSCRQCYSLHCACRTTLAALLLADPPTPPVPLL
jgi:hypothetical protein